MSTSTLTPKNGIASRTDNRAQWISGPHWEPAMVLNGTTYWRCESCGYDSIHERDLYRESRECQHGEFTTMTLGATELLVDGTLVTTMDVTRQQSSAALHDVELVTRSAPEEGNAVL